MEILNPNDVLGTLPAEHGWRAWEIDDQTGDLVSAPVVGWVIVNDDGLSAVLPVAYWPPYGMCIGGGLAETQVTAPGEEFPGGPALQLLNARKRA